MDSNVLKKPHMPWLRRDEDESNGQSTAETPPGDTEGTQTTSKGS
jgi:hypothetical protein